MALHLHYAYIDWLLSSTISHEHARTVYQKETVKVDNRLQVTLRFRSTQFFPFLSVCILA